MKTVVPRIYQAVTQAGFVPGSPYSEVCGNPIGLVLEVYPSMAGSEQHFTTCQGEIAQRYQFRINDTNQKIASIETVLKKIDRDIKLVGFQEVYKWSVIDNEDPTVYFHGFELIVNDGSEQHYSLPLTSISKMDFTYAYRGRFDGYYQHVLTSMMSNLTQ